MSPNTLPSVEDFTAWLTSAPPGDKFIYHVGDLFADRQFFISRLGTEGRSQLSILADAAYRAARTNQVMLVQRRLGPSEWEYIAVKRAPMGYGKRPTTKPELRIIRSPEELLEVLA